MINWGLIPVGTVIPFHFGAYGKTNGESITITGLAVSDIEVYKGTSMTQRSSDAGYALLDTDGIDIDSRTGAHGFSIDTSDNTDASFYEAGSLYTVWVDAITVDSQTVRFIAGTFRLVAAEGVAGTPQATLTTASVEAVADKVWDETRADHTTDGTFGGDMSEPPTNFSTLAVDGSGRVDVGAVAGTAQTAGDLAALINVIDGLIDAIKAKTDSLTFTTANKIDAKLNIAGDVAAAVANKVADHVWRRTTANIEASSDGDTLGHRSGYGALARSVHRRTRASTNLTVYKSDDSTSLVVDVLTATSGLDPISEVNPPA